MSKNQTVPAPPPVDGAFLRVLQEHKQGEILTQLSEELRRVVEAAQACGKTAKLTLEVVVSPNGSAVGFTAMVKTKLPVEKPFAGVFFVDESFNLFRHDPKQPDMPGLRTVEQPEQEELKKAVAS